VAEPLTTSEAREYRACPRAHWYRYELRRRPRRRSDVLALGTFVHLGLEAWFGSTGDRYQAMASRLRGESLWDAHERARAVAMLSGYHARWCAEPLEHTGAEIEFRCPLRNPDGGHASRTFELAGKLDAIVRDSIGRVWVVEHKTSSEDIAPGSEYWQRLRLDPQVSTYLVGAESLGLRPAGVLYDVLRKPALRPYQPGRTRETAETPPQFLARCMAELAKEPEHYYQRGEVVRTEDEAAEAAFDLWSVSKGILESRRLQRWPRNPVSCRTRYGSCSYLPVCCRECSIDDEDRYRAAPVRHEELSEEIQVAA